MAEAATALKQKVKLQLTKAKIFPDSITNRAGRNKQTGQPYDFNLQTVYVDLGKPQLTECEIFVDREKGAYPVGDYHVTTECYEKNKRLEHKTVLIPIK